MLEAADKYNTSMVLLVRNPKGTQHTKRMYTSGEGTDYSNTDDGVLTFQLWQRYFDRKQSMYIPCMST